ncbi:MAG: GNAT family N-acetyltransferase [Acidimicrobiales bacterium]
MPTHLRPLTDEEMATWLANLRDAYIADRMETGESVEEATRITDAQLGSLLPGGHPAPGNLLSRVCVDEGPVGWLWIGPRTPDAPKAFWVWDVVIDKEHRGKGFGKAAMLLAEEQAAAAGAVDLGLNVFGSNAVARHLYESLDYEVMAVQMRKPLTKR